MRFWSRLTSKSRDHHIDPDEIFLDSSNLPEFDQDQFEGRIEKPISRRTIIVAGILFLLVGIIYNVRLFKLQIIQGSSYAERSLNNSLHDSVVFADRGVIADRNNVLLAWNVPNDNNADFSLRQYDPSPSLAPLIGYIKYPSKDSSGFYYREDYIGIDGVEKYFNDRLQGKNGLQITETNAYGKIQSQSVMNAPKNGENLTLSIDSHLQQYLYNSIMDTAESHGFTGGAGVMMDVNTGEILANVSYPGYSSQIMTDGTDTKLISDYIKNPKRMLLDRVADGLYAPGSIVKPVMALAAQATGVISPNTVLETHGYITVPNPYDPAHPSLFRDWQDQGPLDMRKAIQQSSDVYFYEVGGGYGSQQGMGIANIDKYAQMFGYGTTTDMGFWGIQKGTVPTPEWKAKNFNNEPWRIGDTYHSVIGQYGWLVTPIQVVRAVAAIANYGTLLKPTVLANDTSGLKDAIHINLPRNYFDVVHQGMRQSAMQGTGIAMNMPDVAFAVKTGTAQIGVHNEYYNSWIVGFFPYENPKYAFAIVMEHGLAGNLIGAPYVARQFFDQVVANTPEYTQQ